MVACILSALYDEARDFALAIYMAYPTEYGVLDMEYYVIEFDKEGRAIRVSERPYAGKGG